MHRGRQAWIAGALLFVAYVATGRFGLGWFDAVKGVATTVWPPTGLALAALVLFGRRLWPAVALAALAVNFDKLPLPFALLVATGNTLEAVIGATILRRLGFQPALSRVSDVLRLGAAVLPSCAVSAALGTIATMLAHPEADIALLFSTWWVGDVLGAIVVAPLVLISVRARPSPARGLELAMLAILLAVSCAVVFLDLVDAPRAFREIYVLFPLLIWASLRFGVRGATASTFVVCAIAIWGTATGHGPYAQGVPSDNLLLLQTFMGVVVMTVMILAASSEERKRAIEVREEFIGVASHELMTPITAMKIRLQMGRRDAPDGLVRSSIDSALTQVDRVVRLVEQLADVARTGRTSIVIRPESFDLGEAVRDAAERQRADLAHQGCTLALAIETGIRGMWDRMRIEQVVDNLLTNVARHASGGPVEVAVSRDGARAKLVVRDHGAGVPDKDSTRIFERFERIERGGEGLGLGLYVAQQVVLAHRGEIHVEPTPGGGATFVVRLPL